MTPLNQQPVLQPEQGPRSRYLILFRELRAAYFAVLFLVIFIGLAVAVHAYGVFNADIWVSVKIQALRSPLMDHVALFFTSLGYAGVFIAAVVIAAVTLLIFKKEKSALVAGLSLLSYPLNVYVKNLVERTRPHNTLVKILAAGGGFSFPSGHAMISLAVYGTLTYLVWVYLKGRYRAWLVIVGSLAILLIGLSRIYLGVHWFTDVLGGWIGGSIVLLLLIQLHRLLTAPAAPPSS